MELEQRAGESWGSHTRLNGFHMAEPLAQVDGAKAGFPSWVYSLALVRTCGSHRLAGAAEAAGGRRALSALMTKQLEAIFQLGQRLRCIQAGTRADRDE